MAFNIKYKKYFDKTSIIENKKWKFEVIFFKLFAKTVNVILPFFIGVIFTLTQHWICLSLLAFLIFIKVTFEETEKGYYFKFVWW